MNPEVYETTSLTVKETCNGTEQATHVLVLTWDHFKDTVGFSRGVDRSLDKTITQRTVLNFKSSLFDSVGLVATYTIRARLLLKSLAKVRTTNCQSPSLRAIDYSPLLLHRNCGSN